MGHTNLPENKYHTIEKQRIKLDLIEADGKILDIGGGGEGVIGRLEGSRVISIDKRKDELEEAPPGPVKIVMDAAELHFLDHSFEVITAFCTFMYIPRSIREQVFRECFRVLKPGGLFYIWDITIPDHTEKNKEIFVAPLEIILPRETIKTGYGAPWADRQQQLSDYVELARLTGFSCLDQWEQESVFSLSLRKT